MVSSIAIGLGFSTWRAPAERDRMSKIDALALRGVVLAGVAPMPEPYEPTTRDHRRPLPPSLDNIATWHFIR
jgi:hypothetical protein